MVASRRSTRRKRPAARRVVKVRRTPRVRRDPRTGKYFIIIGKGKRINLDIGGRAISKAALQKLARRSLVVERKRPPAAHVGVPEAAENVRAAVLSRLVGRASELKSQVRTRIGPGGEAPSILEETPTSAHAAARQVSALESLLARLGSGASRVSPPPRLPVRLAAPLPRVPAATTRRTPAMPPASPPPPTPLSPPRQMHPGELFSPARPEGGARAPLPSTTPRSRVRKLKRALGAISSPRLRTGRPAAARPPSPTLGPPKEPEEEQFGLGSGALCLCGGLETDQIAQMLQPLAPQFKGVFALDQLDQVPMGGDEPIAFVMNTSPITVRDNTHWIGAIILHDEGIEYYDSLAQPPPRRFLRSLKDMVAKMNNGRGPNVYLKLKINQVKEQASNSANCGWFAIRFIMNRLAGQPFTFATGFTRLKEHEIEKFKEEFPLFNSD